VAAAAPWVTEPLSAQHELEGFDCGEEALNRWLRRHAYASQRGDSSKTRVVCDEGGAVIGYYSLAAGGVDHDDEMVPARIGKGLGQYPIPVVVLTRLAVDQRYQNRGLGKALLADALRRVLEFSETVGIRALLVHAQSDDARGWYLHQAEFECAPGFPFDLFLLMKDLRASARRDAR
jgi:GNAT superfamily N-acetyltransferase